MSTAARPKQYTAEREVGWTIPAGGSKPEQWAGIRIRWRFTGERRWRRQLVVADREQGQTVQYLLDHVGEIVDQLAKRAS